MKIVTRQIAACLNDDGELIGVEARREAVYDDGSGRALDAEPATESDFLSILTGEDATIAAALATKAAQLEAAAAINTALDAEIFGLRAALAEANEKISDQSALIQERSVALADAEKREADASNRLRNLMREKGA